MFLPLVYFKQSCALYKKMIIDDLILPLSSARWGSPESSDVLGYL